MKTTLFYLSSIIMLFNKKHCDNNTNVPRVYLFTQPFLGSFKNPIENSEQFVLSHANLFPIFQAVLMTVETFNPFFAKHRHPKTKNTYLK